MPCAVCRACDGDAIRHEMHLQFYVSDCAGGIQIFDSGVLPAFQNLCFL